jgi:arabinogalactan oligomer / maltooligosaccharide transport system permease protein
MSATNPPLAGRIDGRSVRAESPAAVTYKAPKTGLPRWLGEVGWRHAVGVLFSLFSVFPFMFVLTASLNPTDTLEGQTLIPRTVSFKHYKWLLTHPDQAPFPRWLLNTVVVAGVTALMTVALAALAAYPISRMRFQGRKPGLMVLLLSNMFPSMLLITALYLLLDDLGEFAPALGTGTLLGLILVYLGGALGGNVWLMKSFFDTLPMELDESAKVDGAGHALIFFRIILPLARPILATIFFFSFIFAFNEYAVAGALLSGNNSDFTLAYGLQQFVDGRDKNWGPFAAGAIMAGVPILIVFRGVQRFLVSGLTSGAVKG